MTNAINLSPIDAKELRAIFKDIFSVLNKLKDKMEASENLKEAQHLLEIGAYKPAEGLCDKVLKLNSLDDNNKKTLFALRGYALFKSKQYDDALKDFESSLKIDPKNAFALKNKGRVLAKLCLYDEAIMSYRDAMILYKDENTTESRLNCVATLYCKAKALQSNERYNEAAEIYDEIISINFEDKPFEFLARVYYNHGKIYSARGDHERAIFEYDMAIVCDQTYAEAYIGKIESLKKLGRNAEAELIPIKMDFAGAKMNEDYDESLC